VEFKSGKLLEIREIQDQLDNLSSRVDNLENFNSTNKSYNDELQIVTSEQPRDVVNRKEKQVFTF
jgi:hypothetical protein